MYSAFPLCKHVQKLMRKATGIMEKQEPTCYRCLFLPPSLRFCLHYSPFPGHSIYTRTRSAHTRVNVKSAANQAGLIEFCSSDALSARSLTFSTKIMAFLFATSLCSPLCAGMPVSACIKTAYRYRSKAKNNNCQVSKLHLCSLSQLPVKPAQCISFKADLK